MEKTWVFKKNQLILKIEISIIIYLFQIRDAFEHFYTKWRMVSLIFTKFKWNLFTHISRSIKVRIDKMFLLYANFNRLKNVPETLAAVYGLCRERKEKKKTQIEIKA